MSETFAHVLHEIVRDPRWFRAGLDQALRALTESASEALKVSRVSVWELTPEGTGIICSCLYDHEDERFESGAQLAMEDYPAYFDAISHARVVAVSDAPNDPRTCGLAPGYLRPLNIGALIDAPIMIDGHMAGVVCHEARYGARAWSDAECSFAASIGDLAALAIQSARRREAEETLRKREEEMRLALGAARVADWSYSIASDRMRWSQQVGPLFSRPAGWQPDGLEGYLALVHPDDRASVTRAMTKVLRDGGDYYVDHRGLPDRGSVRWFQCRGRVQLDTDGRAMTVTGVIADDTAHHELELRLARSDRLESLGRLAGAVAHDVNNLLTAISASCSLLDHELRDSPAHARIGVIERAVDKTSNLTKQLLDFSRRLPEAPSSVDLAVLLNQSIELLNRLIPSNILVTVDTPEACWVMADPTKLEQVIMNLAVNGRDAMPDGGTLSFALEPITEDGKQFVELSVSDTGCGIEPALLKRIFEPFFTTKEGQRGTGLGLATCHSIVHQYDGTITAESEIGRGTKFRIRLPSTPSGSVIGDAARHHVLLLEDAIDVAAAVVASLRTEGHDVTHFSSGEQAIQWLQDGGSPTALISDSGGLDAVEVALSLFPGIPASLMGDRAQTNESALTEDIPVLAEPIRANLHNWLLSLAPGPDTPSES